MKRLENIHILIVEDDPTVRLLVKKALEHHGGIVTQAATAQEGISLGKKGVYDLIILDLRLPDGNGYDVCFGLRNAGVETPVLILSAEQDTDVKVKNLKAGADDYLTKPFSIEEMLARIEAIKRRSTSEIAEYICGELKVNLIDRTLKVAGNNVELTNSEFNLLTYLIKHKERVVPQGELAEKVWGIDFDTQTNYINVYISYVRKKIAAYTEVNYIRTVRKKGFKIVCEKI